NLADKAVGLVSAIVNDALVLPFGGNIISFAVQQVGSFVVDKFQESKVSHTVHTINTPTDAIELAELVARRVAESFRNHITGVATGNVTSTNASPTTNKGNSPTTPAAQTKASPPAATMAKGNNSATPAASSASQKVDAIA